MNFADASAIHGGLPQFSELTTKSSVASSGELNSGMQQAQNIYTSTATSMNHGKQPITVSHQNKYPGSIVGWPDPNAFMQFCEKQGGNQAINIPNYNSQNNASLLGIQSNGLPLRIIPNMYLPTTSHPDLSIVKHEMSHGRQFSGIPTGSIANSGTNVASHMQLQQQSAAMAEYLQKLQATSLPLTLQQLMKLQGESTKREKSQEEEKMEQPTNNILNIPSVPTFRNGHIPQNGNVQYMSSENLMMEINPHDLNVHMEDGDAPSEGERNAVVQTDSQTQTQGESSTTEQQMNGETSKSEKKMKFRAKTGEIKIALGLDGSMLYCCPECSLAFNDKADIEQHLQSHVQERKYQCKECGAMLKRKEHLDQHMRGHSDERPFKCPVCQKAFKRNEHLTRHYVIHSGDKNFTCNVCAKAFSRKDHLNKHAQTHLGVKRPKMGKKESIATTMDGTSKEPTENTMIASSEETPQAPKQDISFLQHIHHLQKDQNFIQTFSAFKEQAMRDGGNGGGGMIQQQAVNMNEILPQNARYLMPS